MSEQAKLRFVELFGQPGAGKSTLALSASSSLGLATTRDLSAAWRSEPLHRRILGTARFLLAGNCAACAATMAFRLRLSSGDSLFRLIRLVAKSGWLRTRQGKYLLEEGFLQDLWSIFYSAGVMRPDPDLVAPLIRCLYRGTDPRILFIDTDTAALFDRIAQRPRGTSRFDRLPEAALRTQLLRTDPLPHAIVQAAQIAGLQVDILDGSQPIERLVAQVKSLAT